MKLVPLEDRVVVKVMEQEEKTASGIVLPDTAKEKPPEGHGHGRRARAGTTTTASSSPCRSRRATSSSSPSTRGTEIKLDGEDYLVLRASDIIGILPKG